MAAVPCTPALLGCSQPAPVAGAVKVQQIGVHRVSPQRLSITIEVARCGAAPQSAFRHVADALAAREQLAERLAARASLTDATARIHALSTALFKNGGSSDLEMLDTQRSLYAAQQNSIMLRHADKIKRIALYRALGEGWSERDAAEPPR